MYSLLATERASNVAQLGFCVTFQLSWFTVEAGLAPFEQEMQIVSSYPGSMFYLAVITPVEAMMARLAAK